MKDLQEATERICELKGSLVALDALVPALVEALGASTRARLVHTFDAHAEAARTVMLHADISDVVLATFERDVARNRAVLQRGTGPAQAATPAPKVDAMLLATTRVTTFSGARVLSVASGFYFRRADRLFLVSNRRVFADAARSHRPDRIEIGLHADARDLTRYTVVSLPLYRDGLGLWRATADTGGAVDVAALEVPAGHWPADAAAHAFDPRHIEARDEKVAIGDALTIVGFSAGFNDTLHHLPMARNATVASPYGIRFQGLGAFLTDARTHPCSDGSPVMRRRVQDGAAAAPAWQLLGVHSSRVDANALEPPRGDSMGLCCAWYADVLLALTADR
jgi:hypothetical protein